MVESIVKTLKMPNGVSVSLKDKDVLTMNGPKGTVSRKFKTHRVTLTVEGNKVIVEGTPKNKQTDVLVETITSHLKNMVEGLVNGYKYELKVVYSHFPMAIAVEKGNVNIKNFLGEKFPRKAKIFGTTKVDIKGQDITVSGNNKEDVGQTASNLERQTKVKNKDIRRYQDGIYIVATGNIEENKGKLVEVVRGKE
jgi:large subunit ribosomal protein L6